MNYFRFFPQAPYRYVANNTSWSLNITNITAHAILVQKVKETVGAFHDYVVQDGERPDTVATKLYGSPDFTWVVLIMNNFLTLFDWPLTEYEFNRFIDAKYGSRANAQAVKIYTTSDQKYVDEATYYLLDAGDQGSIRSGWEDEVLKNEAKRKIKVLPAGYIPQIQAELQRAFQ